MDDVQVQLAHERISKRTGIAPRGLDTDKNFTVSEREYISRSCFSEKLPMQKRHPPIGNKPYEKFARFAQVASFSLSQLQATLPGYRCKFFKLGNIDWNFSLKIPHADAREFCASIHFISRLAPSDATESELNDTVA